MTSIGAGDSVVCGLALVQIEGFMPGSRRLAARITGSASAAEDVVQEAFLKAAQAGARGVRVGHVATWFRQIVVRCALDHLQSERRPFPLAENAGEASDNGVEIRAVLAQLTPDHQVVLALAFGEGLSHREIAAALEIPVGTVASRISAAKAAFRTHWSKE